MKNINKINCNYYLKRMRCMNCQNQDDFITLNKKDDNYHRYSQYIFNHYSENPYDILWCNKCKMETLQIFIAMESNKEK